MQIKLILTTLAVSASLSSAAPTIERHSLPVIEYLKEQEHSSFREAHVPETRPGKRSNPSAIKFPLFHPHIPTGETQEEADVPDNHSPPSAIKFPIQPLHSHPGVNHEPEKRWFRTLFDLLKSKHQHSKDTHSKQEPVDVPEKRSPPSAVKFVIDHLPGKTQENQHVYNPADKCRFGLCPPTATDITRTSEGKCIAGEDCPALSQHSKPSSVVYNKNGECIIGDCPSKHLPGYPKSGAHGKKDKKAKKIAKLEARLAELKREYEALYPSSAATNDANSGLIINDVEEDTMMRAVDLNARPEIHTVGA